MSSEGDTAAAAAAAAAEAAPEAVHNSNHHHNDDFNLEAMRDHFLACLGEDGLLNLDKYILGYEELYKFLNLLGTVFHWVASDVHAKLEVLRGHRQSEHGDKYVTIQSMLDHEVESDLIKHKARDSGTGARNLLRLHRALEYIDAFLEAVQTIELADKCCGVSQEAYKKTLIKHHPWVVQKAALLAMHMLPTKEGLIRKICTDDDEEHKKAMETLNQAVTAMQQVYAKTHEEYEKHKLLELP